MEELNFVTNFVEMLAATMAVVVTYLMRKDARRARDEVNQVRQEMMQILVALLSKSSN